MNLEEQLRQTFAAQAELVRVPEDPAGQAIRRARAKQRRRFVASGMAVVLVTALALSGTVWMRARLQPTGNGAISLAPLLELPSGAPTPMISPPPGTVSADQVAPKATSPPARGRLQDIGADLRVGRELWPVSGGRHRLIGVGAVAQVYRIPLGWVYGGDDQVRLLRVDGTSVGLGSLGARWVLSPDGGRLAYVKARRLAVHTISKRGLSSGVSAVVPEQTRPVAFAGDQVVISLGGDSGPYGSVRPPASDQLMWTKTVIGVHGSAGEKLTGLVNDGVPGEVCLAVLEAGTRGLKVTRTGSCRSGQVVDKPTSVLAPGGGWLAEAGDGGTVLVDVKRALEGQKRAVPCGVTSAVPPVWVDGSTLLVADKRWVVRCHTDGATQYVPLPAGLAGDWAFVPRLMPKQVS